MNPFNTFLMAAAPLILGGGTQKFQTEIIGGDLSKKLNWGGGGGGGELNLRGDLKF